MARRPVCDTTVRTTVTVRGRRILLKRDWLHGLWAWAVFDGINKLGWVLNRMESKGWGSVPIPETEEDDYNEIWYDFDTREQAVRSLVPKE